MLGASSKRSFVSFRSLRMTRFFDDMSMFITLSHRSLTLLACLFALAACRAPDPPPPVSDEEETVNPTHAPVFVDAEAGKTWNIFGLQIVGKIMSGQTDGAYSVVMSTTPPEGGPPLHVHENEDELFYVLKGEYEFRYGEESVRVSEGALVHLPRNLPHGFRNVGTEPGVLLNTITPGGFEQFFEEIDQLPKDQPLDQAQVAAIASKYGLTFLPPSQ